MNSDSLIEAMPDFLGFIRPDGLVVRHIGGFKLPLFQGRGSLAGRHLEELLDEASCKLLMRLVRRCLADRANCESEFSVAGADYLARISPQGPERALCIIRQVASAGEGGPASTSAVTEGLERSDFLNRLRRSVTDSVLRERPLALAFIFLDGLADIGRLIDFSIREQIVGEMLGRLPESGAAADAPAWYGGQFGDALLGLVIDGCGDRNQIREVVEAWCAAIGRPVRVHGATFTLTACAGVAVLGQDASGVPDLVDHTTAAMFEARRAGAGTVQFYSDTVRMLPMVRLDVERELRLAIDDRQIGLRYVARHELASGTMVGIHASMRWVHPLRGEIAPSQFLKIAGTTDLAPAVSRAALERLCEELPAFRRRYGERIPVSFGPLRQHVTSGELLADCRRFDSAGIHLPGCLELRISERTLSTLNRPKRALREMTAFGARVVVDEFGGAFSSLAQLPRLPIAGLQMSRALVVNACGNAGALRSCRAIVALAASLDVPSMAPGIDDETMRVIMTSIGCTLGQGDLYPAIPTPSAP